MTLAASHLAKLRRQVMAGPMFIASTAALGEDVARIADAADYAEPVLFGSAMRTLAPEKVT